MEIPALMIHEKGQRSMKMTVFGSFLDPFLTLFGLLGQYGQKGSKSCAMLLIGWPFWPFWHPWKRGSKRWSQKIDIWPFSIDRGLKMTLFDPFWAIWLFWPYGPGGAIWYPNTPCIWASNHPFWPFGPYGKRGQKGWFWPYGPRWGQI